MESQNSEDVQMVEISQSKDGLICKAELKVDNKNISSLDPHKLTTPLEALIEIIQLSLPCVLGFLMMRFLDNLNYAFIGRLENPDYISGWGLAITSSNFLCFAMACGIAGGIDTLSSQAFGNKQNYLAGCYYNRAQVIITVIFLIQAVALWNVEPILIAVGQPKVSARYASEYIKIYLPGIYALCHIELIRRFLAAQGVFFLIVKVQCFWMFTHVIFLLIFVSYLEMDIHGVALTNSLTMLLIFGITIVCILLSKDSVKQNSFHFINKDSFVGIIEYLHYGIPSLLMCCLEFYCFEALIIMAGMLGTNQQGSWIILLNISAFLFMIPLGVSITTANLVGNNLGANNPKQAKLYALMSLLLILGIAVFFVIFMTIFRYQIPKIFTYHEEIINLVAQVMPLAIAFLIFDFIQGTASGIIRAMGYQKIASYFWLVGYWVIWIPGAVIFSFHYDYDLIGIWAWLPIGLGLTAISFVTIIFLVDWVKLANDIQIRISTENEKIVCESKLIENEP